MIAKYTLARNSGGDSVVIGDWYTRSPSAAIRPVGRNDWNAILNTVVLKLSSI